MIENEVKYVLDLAEDFSALETFTKLPIWQGYDENGARFRKQGIDHFFNYKAKAGDVVEEFEMRITESEFNRCFGICVEVLYKTRYSGKDKYGNTWDIDFFYEDGHMYFAMAECEMVDPMADAPEEVHPAIVGKVLYAVPRKDTTKFSSRKLSNVRYATDKLKDITTQKKPAKG